MNRLKPGEILSLAAGSEAVVESLVVQEAEEGEEFTTYNFEVEDFHTYFVLPKGSDESQVDEAVWVHNICSGDMQGILDGAFQDHILSTGEKASRGSWTQKRFKKAWNNPHAVTKFDGPNGPVYVVSKNGDVNGKFAADLKGRIEAHPNFEAGAKVEFAPAGQRTRPAQHHAETNGIAWGLDQGYTLNSNSSYQVATHMMCPGCTAEIRRFAEVSGLDKNAFLRLNKTGFAYNWKDYGRNSWSATNAQGTWRGADMQSWMLKMWTKEDGKYSQYYDNYFGPGYTSYPTGF